MTTATLAPSKPARVYTEEQKAVNRERSRLWYKANPERHKASSDKYVSLNREHIAAHNKQWRADNAEKLKKQDRVKQLRTKYGITLEQRDAMFAAQGSVCAICKTDSPGWKGDWHTDHCHDTKAVRGILCHPCNVMLGNAKDNPTTLAAAISYLEH